MIGRTLANYRVVSQLGAGGMGEVYKAIDVRLDRAVALKVLPPGKSGDPERQARFIQEARSASALNDPHIVTIHDIFTDQGTDVLVMEYVHGRTLRDIIIDGPLRVTDAVAYTLQVAEGVGVAHAAGIVHRDLKPGNIMVTERGHVKVLDFGLAKLTRPIDEQATISGPVSIAGALLGTVDYMSPEQARGEPVDQRSDVFSLGCVLYEMLTGDRPFQAGHPLGVLHEIVSGKIGSPRDRRPEIGPDLDAIVLRSLERDITRRYQSMEALASDLRLAHRRLIDAPGAAPSAAAFVPPPLPVPAGAPTPPPSMPPAPSAHSWFPPAPAPARQRRVRRGPLRLLPVIAVLVFAIPASRGWVLEQIERLRGARAAESTAASSTAATPYEATQQALKLLRRFDRPGNMTSAIQQLEQTIAAAPDYAPAYAAMAQAFARQADLTRENTWSARALDAARQAVRLDPYLADAHVALGVARAASGDHQAAAAALKQALTLAPGHGPAWFAAGENAWQQDRRDEAADAYRKALELMPDDWLAARALGNVAYRAGDYDGAIRSYGLAATLAPDSAIAHNVLGGALHMKGDYAAAAGELQTSISIQPSPSAYSNLGTALFFDGRFQDSVAAFEKAVELRPTDPLMWGNLGDAQRWTVGERDKGRASYLRATQLLEQQLTRDPANVRDRSRLALYLAKMNDKQRALRELSAIERLATRDINTLYRAAVTYELAGDRNEALRWLTMAVEQGYSRREVSVDPELSELRRDVRYQRVAAQFDSPPSR